MDDSPRSAKHPDLIDRRDVISSGLKAAYVIPTILAVVKATERPAYAFVSGGYPEPPRYEPLPPQQDPTPPQQQPPQQPPTNAGPGDPHGHTPPNNHPAPPNHPPSDNHPGPEGEPTITHHAPLPDGVHARSQKPVPK